ncbi:MAG TPA: LytTR family DNA-binding domain-containing protein [Cyclobacteriaceae bacterium]
MNLKCLIVDDEFLARQLLEGYVQKIPYLEIAGSCESAFEAITVLQQHKIDLLFLDINMPELNGINFIKALKHKPEIIITTAYSEHALEGYQLDVIEYLLKPIYFERFLKAVNKAKDLIDLKAQASKGHSTGTANLEGNSFFIKTSAQKITRIKLFDILYIESLHEYVRIHLNDTSYTIYHSLKNLLDILPTDQFIQIHRSYIVNFNRVTCIEGNTAKIDQIELNVGKNFKEDFLNRVKLNSIGFNQK